MTDYNWPSSSPEEVPACIPPGPWYPVVNDLVGGWSVATVGKPCSEHSRDPADGEVVVADMLDRATAHALARLQAVDDLRVEVFRVTFPDACGAELGAHRCAVAGSHSWEHTCQRCDMQWDDGPDPDPRWPYTPGSAPT